MQRANKFIAQEFQAYFWTLKIKQIKQHKKRENYFTTTMPMNCIEYTHQRHNYFAIQQCCYFRFMNLDILSPMMLLYKLYFRHGYCYKSEKWTQSHCELISELFCIEQNSWMWMKWVYFYVNNKNPQCFAKRSFFTCKLWQMLI